MATPATALTGELRTPGLDAPGLDAPGHRTPGHRSTVLDAEAPLPQNLLRLRGGTYSPTVSRVTFTDGETARTDLISLTPDVDAYSVQFAGTSPPQRAHYRALPWTSAAAELGAAGRSLTSLERDVARIIGSSYPAIDLTSLSRRVRAAGLGLGRSDLREHQAIAATQAAIWHLTDGLDLETRSLTHPELAELWTGNRRSPVAVSPFGVGPALLGTAPRQSITLHLPQAPVVDAYTFQISPASGRIDGIRAHLETSSDGIVWHEVPSSRAQLDRFARPTLEGWQVTKGLGSGATVQRASGRHLVGYPYHRLVLWGAGPGTLHHLTLAAASTERRNDAGVVALYRYLLGRLGEARSATDPRAALLLGSATHGGRPEFTTLALAIAAHRPDGAARHTPSSEAASVAAVAPRITRLSATPGLAAASRYRPVAAR